MGMGRGGARPGSGRKPKTVIPESLWQSQFVLPTGLSDEQTRLVRELCQRVSRAGRKDAFRRIKKAVKGAIAESRLSRECRGGSETNAGNFWMSPRQGS